MLNPGKADWPISSGLWSELDGRLWHATSRSHLAMILRDGEIRPGSRHTGSLSYSLNAVSLFDFGPSAADDANQIVNLVGWFGGQQEARCAVWLEIDRPSIKETLLDAGDARIRYRENLAKLFIPGLEACHIGPVPTRSILRVLLVARDDWANFRSLGQLDGSTLVDVNAFESGLPESPSQGLVAILRKGREGRPTS